MTDTDDPIARKTVYWVQATNSERREFDTALDAAAAVVQLLHSRDYVRGHHMGTILNGGDAEFGGFIGIQWGEEEVPATPLDVLLDEWGQNIHGGSMDIADLDRAQPYLLVEENCRGGYWLTTGESVEWLVDYSLGQEYAEEWEIVGVFDTATGDEVDFEVAHTVTVKS